MKKFTFIISIIFCFFSATAVIATEPPSDDDCLGCTRYEFDGGAGFGSEVIKYERENIVHEAYGSAGFNFTVDGQTPNPVVKVDFSGYGNSLSEEGYNCSKRWAKNTLDFKFHFRKTDETQ